MMDGHAVKRHTNQPTQPTRPSIYLIYASPQVQDQVRPRVPRARPLPRDAPRLHEAAPPLGGRRCGDLLLPQLHLAPGPCARAGFGGGGMGWVDRAPSPTKAAINPPTQHERKCTRHQQTGPDAQAEVPVLLGGPPGAARLPPPPRLRGALHRARRLPHRGASLHAYKHACA